MALETLSDKEIERLCLEARKEGVKLFDDFMKVQNRIDFLFFIFICICAVICVGLIIFI